MKVKATRMGYYNYKRVKPGTVFDVKDNEFSSKWMSKLGKGKPAVDEEPELEPEKEVQEDSVTNQEVI